MSEFQLWDVVQVKSWDEMEKEFGFNNAHNFINVNGIRFTLKMQYLCGKRLTIAGFSENGGIRSLEGIEFDEDYPNLSGYWRITDGMVKLVSCKEYKPATDDDFERLFENGKAK